jgi:Uma2 family endonuclease
VENLAFLKTICYRREKDILSTAEGSRSMAAHPRGLYMSVEEYLELDSNSLEGRYEYIDGYVYMLAGGTADHSTISMNMTSTLRRLLHGSSCRVYNTDVRVRLSKRRYVYPDASVTCDPRERGKITTIEKPRLVVEILSSSTEAYDRGRKFSFYRECPSIQEYVLVSTEIQAVEVFRRESENLWTLHPFGPGYVVELTSLEIRFPIEAIYEDVVLPDDESDGA